MSSPTTVRRVPQRLLTSAAALTLPVVAMGAGPTPASGSPAEDARSVLLVVGDDAEPTPGDVAIADRFAELGLTATLVSDEDVSPAEAETHDLVWISGRVVSHYVHDDLPDISTPTIVSKPWLFDDFGLTERPTSNYDVAPVTEIAITASEDPTAGGLSGTIAPTPGRTGISIANPTESAIVVATAVSTQSRVDATPTIFHIPPGSALADETPAPACRLSFPAFQDHPVDFGTEAWTLFDATASHALANCATPQSARPEIMFGLVPGVNRQDDLVAVEDTLGRQLDLVRVFERWDSRPGAFHEQVAGPGRTMALSVRARHTDGRPVAWRDIADARPGSAEYAQMVAWANHVKGLGTEVLFSFNHEPETTANTASGSAEDYVAAWRRFRQVFAAEGVDNARWTWIMTAWSFHVRDADRRAAENWYPGDDEVEVLGVDAYNWSGCHPDAGPGWRSLAEVVEPFREFADLHPQEDLFLAEWASTESPAGDKGSWIHDAREMFTQPAWDRLIGVSYFNDNTAQPTCSFPIDSSPGALAALRAMAEDPRFGG